MLKQTYYASFKTSSSHIWYLELQIIPVNVDGVCPPYKSSRPAENWKWSFQSKWYVSVQPHVILLYSIISRRIFECSKWFWGDDIISGARTASQSTWWRHQQHMLKSTQLLQKSIFFKISFAKMLNLVFSFDWRGHMMIFLAISEKLISRWIFWYFMKTPKNLGFVLLISPKVYIGLPRGFRQTRVPFFISLEMYRT